MSPDPAVTEASAKPAGAGTKAAGTNRDGGGPPPVRAARSGTTPEEIARAARAKAAAEAAGDVEADPEAPDAEAAGTAAAPAVSSLKADQPPDRAERPDPPERANGRARLVTAEEVLSRRQRRHVERLRARKVRRVVRHVDAWSVLKVSLLFYLCSYVIGLVSSVILWNVADRAGYIEKVESFIEDLFAYETFEFLPGTLFTAAALGGAILAIVATGLTALGAVLFNLISDLMGGVRLTMVELPGARPALRPRKAARLATRTAAAVEREASRADAAEPADA